MKVRRFYGWTTSTRWSNDIIVIVVVVVVAVVVVVDVVVVEVFHHRSTYGVRQTKREKNDKTETDGEDKLKRFG